LVDELYFPNDVCEKENLKYIAGSVANKYKIKYPYLEDKISNSEKDWISHISKGYYILP